MRDFYATPVGLAAFTVATQVACGGSSVLLVAVADGSTSADDAATADADAADVATADAGGVPLDSGPTCIANAASWSFYACPACPDGSVCTTETGGVAGGGGSWCVSIPPECAGTPTCACMATCACTHGVGGRPEKCTDRPSGLECNNGIT
jgi:hypothetical protein